MVHCKAGQNRSAALCAELGVQPILWDRSLLPVRQLWLDSSKAARRPAATATVDASCFWLSPHDRLPMRQAWIGELRTSAHIALEDFQNKTTNKSHAFLLSTVHPGV